jgi:alpha-beta hydrolase superfamily lysophospholipase
MTENPQVRTFTDSYDVESKLYVWAAKKPRAVVQLVHGLGDHARRYDALAEFFTAKGFTVYADDHRGHGETGLRQVRMGQTKTLGNLGPGGMVAARESVHEVTKLIKHEHPKLPLIILGQSWGSFITQKLLNNYSHDYDMAVLTGTTLTTPTKLGAFGFNKKWDSPTATGFEWLSRDPEVGKRFVADPKAFYADAAKVFGIANSLRIFGTPAKTVRSDLPLLVMVGSEDPLGAERGAKALVDAYRKNAGVVDVELIVYNDARHELFNETNRDEVYADLLGWIESNLGD